MDIYQVLHCSPGSFDTPAPNRLYQQQADGTFREVPNAGGLNDSGFGHGVAVGDIDNDGDYDVLVTNFGPNRLYLNDKGQFRDITQAAGLKSDAHWSSSAGFLDYDRDGDLDLYVCHFGVFHPEKLCFASKQKGDRDYCGPDMFEGLVDDLYRNNGDGTFTPISESAGIRAPARGWGVVCADLTGDGWCDIYVANDEEPAQLWVNQQDGTFLDEAAVRGCAFNAAGKVEAGMGLAIGDINGDATLDLLKTHIAGETNTLFVASPGDDRDFTDQTAFAGMGAVDRPYTGWGTGFFDYDHDGDLDVAVANGRVAKGFVWHNAQLGKFWNQFAEPKLLFENDGRGRFTNVSAQAGRFGSVPENSRALAFADLDDDGDIDLVANNVDNTLRVYRNVAPKADNHWLMVRAMTDKRDAYGALITIEAGGKQFVRLAHPTYSYTSSNDPRAHFGLGQTTKVESLTVAWPSGRTERFAVDAVDQVVTVVERQGIANDN